ncbi:hypothetical protein D1AOALGA4SA_6741 [Olavius algarvensis Delta 1 endosymbiont]|nr:hypothetical protein D1AOALGA4SA_6741 [Olavius algarvensis Delta 1 endosymbiont]
MILESKSIKKNQLSKLKAFCKKFRPKNRNKFFAVGSINHKVLCMQP